jgi:hypothetical protein
MNFKTGTTTDIFVQTSLAGLAHMMIFNDNANNSICFSFDGVTITGVVTPLQGLEFDDLNEDVVWVRSYVLGSAGTYRVNGWGDRRIIYPKNQQPSFNHGSDVPNNMNTGALAFNPPETGILSGDTLPQKTGAN